MNYYTNNCKVCARVLKGRSDKKFCDDHCRNAYHGKHNRDISNYMRSINNIFRKNRRILRALRDREPEHITQMELIHLGYRMDYFTHEWEDESGSIHKYNYDIGIVEMKGHLLISKEQTKKQITFQNKAV